MKTALLKKGFLLLLCNIILTNVIFAYTVADDISLSIVLIPTDGSCNLCNGNVDLQVSGGQMPYTFEWDNGATTEDIEDLCVGVYEVIVTDDTGCSATGNVFVGNNNLFDVTLESQSEVDDFVAQFGDCTSINGTLRIGTTFASPNSDISDISGLNNLTSIGSSLFIFQNPNLSSLTGLNNLEEVGSSIHLNSNNGLTSLSPLSGITELGGALLIDNHTDLLLLDGLNNLTSVGGNVYISNNSSLTDLSALSLLATIGGDLDIRIAPQLFNFTGLEQLTSIGGDLIIRDNFALTNISALDHSISIGGDLTIENTALSNCAIEPVCALLQSTATATISNNQIGCNSEIEVGMACSGGILGIALTEMNINCGQDCTGSIIADVSGGIEPYQYLWSNGETTMTISDLCAGSYVLTVTDNSGTSIVASASILSPSILAVSASQTSPACFLECNGQANVIITGGTPPYTFEPPIDLCAGDYNLTITDDLGCTVVAPFTINGSAVIVVTVDQITNESSAMNDGSISIVVFGGSFPFTFSWQLNGVEVSTDQNPSGLSAGNYMVFITDALGCTIPFGTYTVGAPVATTILSESDLRIYPNPASAKCYIHFENANPEAATYSLWTTSGVLVQEHTLSQNATNEIDVESLTTGIYILRIMMDGKTIVRKLMVQ